MNQNSPLVHDHVLQHVQRLQYVMAIASRQLLLKESQTNSPIPKVGIALEQARIALGDVR